MTDTQTNSTPEKRDANTKEPIEKVSLEELDEALQKTGRERTARDLIDTQHRDGSTANPQQAEEQGLVYTPPHDPPILPSDDPQGAEVAAGFAPSIEASDPDVQVLPDHVDDNDLDLEQDVQEALRTNSETSHLTDLHVRVSAGEVYVWGEVASQDDIGVVQQVLSDLDGVMDVHNHLRTAA